MNDFPLLLSAEKSQTSYRPELTGKDRNQVIQPGLGILRTKVWTVKDHYPMKKILLFNFCGDEQ
jgi:hypothetical protein